MKTPIKKLEVLILRMRGHLSCLFPAATKRPKAPDHLFSDAILLYDFCSRKRQVPPNEDWPDEIARGLEKALINCDGDFFRLMAKAADHMRDLENSRSAHATHVTSMIHFAAQRMGVTGEKPTKQELIEGTHALLLKMGKKAFPVDSPQLWTPILAGAGFGGNPKEMPKGTKKRHGQK